MQIVLPQKVLFLIQTLSANGHEAYAVGGCVRDSLLGRVPEDWDVTTSASPQEVKALFRRTVDTGIQHGTVTVLLGSDSFEVTTYRTDGIYEDGRHPKQVSFTHSLTEDLRRRDFTVNAMAYNETDGLVDCFGGQTDLEQRVLRCVGDANARFDEDALRILRAVRFAAQLDFTIADDTLSAISSHVENLRRISMERIRDELCKLLRSPHPERLLLLHSLGITGVVLPEFDAFYTKATAAIISNTIAGISSPAATGAPSNTTAGISSPAATGVSSHTTTGISSHAATGVSSHTTAGISSHAATGVSSPAATGASSNATPPLAALCISALTTVQLPEEALLRAAAAEPTSPKQTQLLLRLSLLLFFCLQYEAPATAHIALGCDAPRSDLFGMSVVYRLARTVMRRFKFDNDSTSVVARLSALLSCSYESDEVGMRRTLAQVGAPLLPLLFAAQEAVLTAQGTGTLPPALPFTDIPTLQATKALFTQVLASGCCTDLKALAVNGSDLLSLGCKAGKTVGALLDTLLALVLEEPQLNDRDCLLSRARELLSISEQP